MKPIGGYFELELPMRSPMHSLAMALNTGRNCLEYILRTREYRRVYLPYYACEVLLEPFEKFGIHYTFYHVDNRLEIQSPMALDSDDALLYINYFGLKQDYVKLLAERYGNQLIVDNTQAFYAQPVEGVDTFYSCRKFFGVPDGAYLYCDKSSSLELEQDESWERMGHLLKRIDLSPEAAYDDFKAQNDKLKNNPIKMMSRLTTRLMASIDHDDVRRHRVANYRQLHGALREKNLIFLPLTVDAVPMVYPFMTDDETLRQRLIDNKIFVAQYWPNVLQWCAKASMEYKLTKHLLPLPIDQRYGPEDMNEILSFIV